MSKEFKSINPYNQKEIASYDAISDAELNKKLELAGEAFKSWRKRPIAERAELIAKAAEVLRENVNEYARMITLEMGKPITEAKGEVKKCAWVCDYYAENAEAFLADEEIETDATRSFVRNSPIGAVFAVMPWNFPFWQVFRFAAPTLTAGNTGLLKHASNVIGCAKIIEDVFTKAGFPKGVFQTLLIQHEQSEKVISNKAVQAVSLTGSEKAGSSIAEIAGRHIRKSLLELGGSNAFIVWEDADLDQVVETAVNARMMNTGQSCIAAKRFIVLEGVYDAFVEKFVAAVKERKAGDPLDESTEIGPLARKDLADQLKTQIDDSTAQGADLLLGGNQDGCFVEATVLGNVKPGMAAFDEETFGPLAAMIKATSIEEAFELAEKSKFGLGMTVCTKNVAKALEMIEEASDGAYFINELVKSDPRLPFGGTKYSGYGRELGKDGIMEFVNRKTVYVK